MFRTSSAVAREVLADTRMGIAELLSPESVVPSVEARGKEEVMEALASRLAGCHREVDGTALVAALRERERQVSTALADGVAIPHARMRGLSRIVAAFGRSRSGIDCGSHDGRPTHFFLLLVMPDDAPGSHLKLLATASRVLHDEGCRTRLMQATDATALLEALRAEEARARGTARAA